MHWVQQVARFCNRMLVLQGSSRLISLAFQDNLDLMQEQLALKARTGKAAASPCWCLRWIQALSSVAPTHAGTLVGVTELDEEALVARAKAQFVRAAAAIPSWSGSLRGFTMPDEKTNSATWITGDAAPNWPTPCAATFSTSKKLPSKN